MRKMVLVAALCGSGLLEGCGGGGGGSDSAGAPTGSAMTNNAPPTSTYSGVVADKNGVPIAGVTVTVYLTNDHTDHVTTTDANGRYTFAGLAAGWAFGNYEIWADKAGFGFSPSIQSGAGSVIKSDHNALYKMVIAISPQFARTVTDANFTALRAGDKLISLPQTGQTISYTPGDDASAAKGVAWPVVRFTDHNDGTVTDTLTGLVWLKNAGCFGASNWSDALASASQLASGSCGLSDGSTAGQWRMPNVGELESLIDVSRNNPALTAGNPFTNVAPAYWSATTYRGVTADAWVIRFTDGRYINDSVGNVKAGSQNSLWALKAETNGAIKLPATGQFIVYANNDDAGILSGTRLSYPRFVDNADGTVSDTVTGLTWMKRADCIHAQWADAATTINSLSNGQCGLSDGSTAGQWRMPNRAEMLSLVDRAETNQALKFNSVFYKPDNTLDQAPIFSTFYELEYYWTSTTNAADLSQAWTLFSCDYGVYNIVKSNVGYSLAVR